MSGAIAALMPQKSGTSSKKASSISNELREHYARLIPRLQDPYLRALVTHLTASSWSPVLIPDSTSISQPQLPFRERLAIALHLLDDASLSSYLLHVASSGRTSGSLSSLLVTGLPSTLGMQVLQGYVDRTGDIQSAAILGAYVVPGRIGAGDIHVPSGVLGTRGKIPPTEKWVERWIQGYRDLLDGFKLFHLRVSFDIERGHILTEGRVKHWDVKNNTNFYVAEEEWAPRQILIRCHYCNKSVNGSSNSWKQQREQVKPYICYFYDCLSCYFKPIYTCGHCGRELPRCSVCLMTLSIISDAAREIDLGHTHNRGWLFSGLGNRNRN